MKRSAPLPGTKTMSETVDRRQIFWDQPVRAGGSLIFGPREALEFLMKQRAAIKSSDFAAAVQSVRNALHRKTSPDYARELFARAIETTRLEPPKSA